MYGVKQLQFDSTYPEPACDACNNKHLSLFSLGEYCKVYDNKTCCFSELAKEQIHLCKECVFALRKTKVFQTRCFNAQKIMQSYFNLMYPHYEQLRPQADSDQQTTGHRPPPAGGSTRRDVTRNLIDFSTTVPHVCACVRRH